MSRCFACLFAVCALTACPGKSTIVDSGTAGGTGGSGGAGGGAAGGVANDDQCDFGGPRNCPAGSACVPTELDGGARAKRCHVGECDVVDQECDAGLRCTYNDGGRVCIADGVLNEGQACAGAPVPCRKGLACTIVATDAGSACTRFCRVNTDCGSPMQCYLTLEVENSTERPFVCADPPTTCDPLMQNCPLAGDGCYPGMGGPGCFPAHTTANNAMCTYSNDCLKGSACTGSSGTTVCKPMCAFPTGTPACDAGTCTRLSSSQTVGVCL